jgi:prepilin peptidase CpaA
MTDQFAAVPTILLLAVLGTGFLLDLRTRRIPNWLTISGMLCGLGASLLPGGTGPVESLSSIGIAFLVGLPFFALRAMGAGDVKFLMAGASFFAPPSFLWSLLLVAVAGGVLAVIVSLSGGRMVQTLRRSGLLLLLVVTGGRLGARATLETPDALAIPYGVAIAVGVGGAWIGGLG